MQSSHLLAHACRALLCKRYVRYTGHSYGGSFKSAPNEIGAVLPSGKPVTLFTPLEPHEVPGAMERLCDSYNTAIAEGVVDPLLLIPCFVLDFLCIHPFKDGNGRMSRLLTLLLLHRAGYLVGRYVSIGKAIADTKDAYYSALSAADAGWHTGENDPKPFIEYMLGVVLSCYRDFDSRVNVAGGAGVKPVLLRTPRPTKRETQQGGLRTGQHCA